MHDIFIAITLGLFGLILGSFSGATVWRLRARQLVADKKHGESIDAAEYKRLRPLTRVKLTQDRSRCLHCGYELRWYDLLPLVSWVSLGGKCRSCRRPIGWFEPLIELGLATFFVISYIFWPFALTDGIQVARFVIWLTAGVGFTILFAYDYKWFLLPDSINYTVVVLGLVSAILSLWSASDWVGVLFSIVGSVAILGGLYAALHYGSGGRWVGFGDVKLGLGLGLLLADWTLAFLAVFAANLIGCLVVLAPLIRGKLKPTSQVPFGPLLIVGTIIAQLAGPAIIAGYMTILL